MKNVSRETIRSENEILRKALKSFLSTVHGRMMADMDKDMKRAMKVVNSYERKRPVQ